jgi:hypothetical protein
MVSDGVIQMSRSLLKYVLVGLCVAGMVAAGMPAAATVVGEETVGLSTAQADGPSQDVIGSCNIVTRATINPGLPTLTQPDAQVVAIAQQADNLDVTCVLTVNGEPVAGQGSAQFVSHLDGSCRGTTTRGQITIFIGGHTISRDFQGTAVPPVATFSGDDFTGTAEATLDPTDPDSGDCVTTPLRKVISTLTLVFTGA